MKPVVLILGALALLAAGGGAAVLLMNGQHAASVPAPVAQQATPDIRPAPASAAVNFVPLVQNFSLLRDSAAFVAASQDAPQFYPLKAGTPVVSAARSPDGVWTVAMTADARAAFIPSADMGPYDPKRAPKPLPPETLSGAAQVVDTGTLMIDGQTVPLAGLIGRDGEPAAKMQSQISKSGSQVNCTLQQTGGYICTLPSGMDLGRMALFNGAAEPGNDASADYREQADAARDAHRGMWK